MACIWSASPGGLPNILIQTATSTEPDALKGHSENCLNTRVKKRQVPVFLEPDLIDFTTEQARLNHESRGHYIRRLIRRELNASKAQDLLS